MIIKVISLSSARRRRQSIEKQFSEIDADYSFYDAVTPSEALLHVSRYDDREFNANCSRSATAQEIACYASHLNLWQQCAEGTEPFVILEDDALLESRFVDGLRVIEQEIGERGIIRLSFPSSTSTRSIDIVDGFNLQYCRRVPLLALGYAISPAAARRLARTGKIVEEPVDKFIQRFWRHGQPVYALAPYVVGIAPLWRDSTIGKRVRPKYNVACWVRQALRKSENSINRAVFNFRFFLTRPFARPDR